MFIGRIRQRFQKKPRSDSHAEIGNEFSPAKNKTDRAHNKTVYIAKVRLMYASALFAAFFLAISARLVDLTLFQESNDSDIKTSAELNAATFGRANIIDRNGTLLASSLATASLYANPKDILDVADAVEKLSGVLPDLNKKDLQARLSSKKSFVWIKRNLTPEQHYKVHLLGLPGFSFQREDRRVYPLSRLTSHVLGFTDVDNKGIAGIEKSFDTYLRKSTQPLQLTIDTRVQNILRDELQRAIRDFTAKGGAGIVMDARSGEILGMVSLPDFDPHNTGSAPDEARFNRATLGVYEMGSTFKIFNTAMALDSGKVHMHDRFDATQPIRIGRHKISDYHPQNRWLDVEEIFEHSSNIGSVRMAQVVGTVHQKAFLTQLGLLHPATVELPEIGNPMIPARWSETTLMTVSFGYGISVTPIQLIRASAAIVNGGILPDATLVKRKNENGVNGVRVVSENTSRQMRDLLRDVVTKGTGKNADVQGYFVGGKTGTAEKHSVGGYAQKKLISSFVGTFPIQDPQYIILAMIDEPVGNKASFGFATAGYVAAPAVSRIVARMAPLLGLPPTGRAAIAANNNPPQTKITKPIIPLPKEEESEPEAEGLAQEANYEIN